MQRLLHFVKYNNALPIGFAILFLGATGVFAASPEARDSIVKQESKVVSIDNSYIVNINLSSFTPRVEIREVTEDDANYYVSYVLYTIDLHEGVWQDLGKETVLQVAKTALDGRDLGLYVTEELKEVIDGESRRLVDTQEIERGVGLSNKIVATAYSGLVGKFLDGSQETLPGYQPVIPDPVPQTIVSVDGTSQDSGSNQTDTSSTSSQPTSTSKVSGDSSDTEPPVIQILGINPANLLVGARYVDLGAVVTDNVNRNIGIDVTGAEIDTLTPGEYTVTYYAEDVAGNSTTATRLVIVTDPNAVEEKEETATSTPGTSSVPIDSEAASTTVSDKTEESASSTGGGSDEKEEVSEGVKEEGQASTTPSE